MNTVIRLITEYSNILRTLSASGSLEYFIKSIFAAPQCLKQRKLMPIDERMAGNYDIQYRGKQLKIPAKEIDEYLADKGDGPTFSTIREMFGNDVYIRGFRNLNVENVLDLGSNRGFFLLIALKALEAKKAVGVEALSKYKKVFPIIANHNGIPEDRWAREFRIAGDKTNEETISIPDILDLYSLDRVSLLKCDIEGGEFDVFSGNTNWLDKVDNIAMELHPKEGDPTVIETILSEHGFKVKTTNQFFEDVAPLNADYLYASKQGKLVS